MPLLTLAEQDARIVALGIAYHLGRPGSETDPDTLLPHDQGLGPVQMILTPQIGRAQASLELTPYQLHRLDEALLGVVNELKQYELAQPRSAVPGLEAAIGRLFPTLATGREGGDPESSALDLVTQAVQLRRRLRTAVAEANATLEAERAAAAEAVRAARRPWWQWWRRA